VIGHQGDFAHGAVLAEQVFEVVFGGVEGKISYVQFHILVDLILERFCPD